MNITPECFSGVTSFWDKCLGESEKQTVYLGFVLPKEYENSFDHNGFLNKYGFTNDTPYSSLYLDQDCLSYAGSFIGKQKSIASLEGPFVFYCMEGEIEKIINIPSETISKLLVEKVMTTVDVGSFLDKCLDQSKEKEQFFGIVLPIEYKITVDVDFFISENKVFSVVPYSTVFLNEADAKSLISLLDTHKQTHDIRPPFSFYCIDGKIVSTVNMNKFDESSLDQPNGFNQPFNAILSIAKSLCSITGEAQVNIKHFHMALSLVELNPKSYDLFSQMFNAPIDRKLPIDLGNPEDHIRSAQNLSHITYDEQVQIIIKSTEKAFDNENICKLRK